MTPRALPRRATGEPGDAMARLSGVMTDLSPASDHASHDTILVSSLADHSLPASERAAAEALVATCSQCADLQADLLALRAATRAMPTPARPTDYTLTERDAARLRSGGWRRFVAILGTSRDALSRPLAVGLTTLGLAGLLVSAAPSFMMGSASSGAAPTTVGAPAGGQRPRTATGRGRLARRRSLRPRLRLRQPHRPPRPQAILPDRRISRRHPFRLAPRSRTVPRSLRAPRRTRTARQRHSQVRPAATPGEPDGTSDLLAVQDIGGVSPLPVLSVAFLVAGLALFALRWTARRFGG